MSAERERPAQSPASMEIEMSDLSGPRRPATSMPTEASVSAGGGDTARPTMTAPSAPVAPSGMLDAVSGFGAGLRGDDAFSSNSGHTAGKVVGTGAKVASMATYAPGVSEALMGINPDRAAQSLGTGMQAAALMQKEARGEKPTDVASEARKDYVAADMQRMVARSKPAGSGGKLKSAVMKGLAASRLGKAVQEGGHRAAYESTMEESEQVNQDRPETSGLTKAMQTAALPFHGLNRAGQAATGSNHGEEDLLKGNYKTAIAQSSATLAAEGTKAALSTAGHVALPVVGSVAATTAFKAAGYGAQGLGTAGAKAFDALGGGAQDQADAYDKQWHGGSDQDRADGTAETRAHEVLRRGFRSRGQATGENAVGWAKSGAKEEQPAAAPQEPGAWGWLKSKVSGLWGSGKTAAKHAAYDAAAVPAIQGMNSAKAGYKSARGLGGRISDTLSSWWKSLTGAKEKKPAEDEGIEMTSMPARRGAPATPDR